MLMDRTESPVVAPMMGVRRLFRAALTYHHASEIGDIFVRTIPQNIQRLTERQFDFPISKIIRCSPLLLVRVPKTASVSLALQLYGRISHIPHRSAMFYRYADPEFFRHATSFAVVRHPRDRLFSAYRWLRGAGNELAAPNRRSQKIMRAYATFDSFVLDYVLPAFQSDRLHRLDAVLHHQCDYVCDENGKVIVDRIFNFENMAAVQAFLAQNGVERREQRENTTEFKNYSRDVLTGQAVEAAINLIYGKDFSTLGFSSERLDIQSAASPAPILASSS